MDRERLSRVFAPITTLFNEKGDILLEKLFSNIRHLNQSRLRGYLVLGTNGELCSLSHYEQMEVLKTVVKTASPDKVIMAGMKKKGFTAEQIVGKLREAEVLMSQGNTVGEVSRRLGVTEQTYY